MADAKLIPVEDAYHGFGTSDVASAAAIDLIKQLSNS